jgi:thiol:disulfide interchange protein
MRNPAILLCLVAFLVACGQQEQTPAVAVEDAGTTEVHEVQWILDDFQAASAMASQEGKLIFIDFYADWCPPCRTLSDEFFPRDDYQSFFSGFVTLKINVDNVPDLADRYGISSIPTLIVTDWEGNEIDRVVGITGSPEDFLETLNALGTE